jgi:hypothetical protein
MGEVPRGNRRHSYRAGVHGCAIVHAPGNLAIRCGVIDVSLGGVRLEPLSDEERLVPGTQVSVELECAGAGWVWQRGVVIRHVGAEVVVGFYALGADVEDLIEDEILGAVEAERQPRVVVVDGSCERRHAVAEELRRRGLCSLEAATPLEAIELVERSRNHVSAVALSGSLTQTQADELVGYLQETHPEVVVARIEQDAVDQLAQRLRR